jgi:hypothetical protein
LSPQLRLEKVLGSTPRRKEERKGRRAGAKEEGREGRRKIL